MQTNVLRIQDLANPAGALTALRLLLAIAFPFIAHDPDLALTTYLIAIATDVGDGAIARRMNQASHTGAVLDGWVDKVLHINGAWSLTLHGYMPAWWMWMWFSREIVQWGMVMTIIGDFRTGHVRVQETSFWGRLTAVSLFAAFCCTILGMEGVTFPLSVVTCLAGLAAATGYLQRHLEDRKRFD